jgi:hypothetical protein
MVAMVHREVCLRTFARTSRFDSVTGRRVDLLRLVFDKVIVAPTGIVAHSLTPAFTALREASSAEGDHAALASMLLEIGAAA